MMRRAPVAIGCTDAMAFIGDLNLDDNNMQNPPIMSPGQAFRKGWRVKNIGTCTWNSGYSSELCHRQRLRRADGRHDCSGTRAGACPDKHMISGPIL